jgi:predicted NUDIX family NTP pyrophosphohydrolase
MKSAALLMYRRAPRLELFLVHPGGPFFRKKDDGSWSIPKGEVEPDEDPLLTARREFTEETGLQVPETGFVALGEIRQRGGKHVVAWAFDGDCDPAAIASNTFEIEWPPRSGHRQGFPEVDRAAFFTPELARTKLNPAQVAFVDRLQDVLAESSRIALRRR